MGQDDTPQEVRSTQNGATVCRTCREQIKLGATKCIYCDSYQDWTRYLVRWSTVLVGLLGIVPLWGIASALHELAFSPKTANVEAALTSCKTNQVTVAFANSGKFDGIVTDVNLFLVQDGKRKKTDFELRPGSDVVVSPNKPPVTVTYKAYIGRTETIFISKPRMDQSCTFVVEINWMDFKGSSKQISRICSCP